jgi:predicted small lipoprotein YifL
VKVLSHRSLARRAAFGALALALGLAGCGRKSGLDPPPAAAIAKPVPGQPEGQKDAHADAQTRTPTTPAAQKKSFFLDWLID